MSSSFIPGPLSLKLTVKRSPSDEIFTLIFLSFVSSSQYILFVSRLVTIISKSDSLISYWVFEFEILYSILCFFNCLPNKIKMLLLLS